MNHLIPAIDGQKDVGHHLLATASGLATIRADHCSRRRVVRLIIASETSAPGFQPKLLARMILLPPTERAFINDNGAIFLKFLGLKKSAPEAK
jgi:hypothetical protein